MKVARLCPLKFLSSSAFLAGCHSLKERYPNKIKKKPE
jgi:hypothetical protein